MTHEEELRMLEDGELLPEPDYSLEPDEMWAYEVNADDSLHICRHKRKDPLPANLKELPVKWDLKGKMYYDNGKFTKVIKTKEEIEFNIKAEEKIENKMRELAIKELKKAGELPEDYKEK